MTNWVAKSRAEAGEVLGVGPRQITEYCSRGCPGGRANYPIPEMVAWFRDHVWNPHADLADGDPLLAGGGKESQWLEKYRKERTRLARMERLERQRNLIPREKVHEGLVIFAETMRRGAEQIQNDYPEAAKIMHECLDEIEQAYRDRFGEKSAA